MKFSTAALAAALAAGVVGTATAAADPADTNIHQSGTQATVADGGVIQGLTVSNLKPSSDVIPYQPAGALWEATVADEAIQGTVVPLIANFGARAATGQTYQALFSVPTAQGIPPATLTQGQKISGKLYFDVAGEAPNSVVYDNAGQGPVIWLMAPAPSSGSAGQGPTSGGVRAPAPSSGGGARTPAPPNRPTTPGGSRGTQLPEGTSPAGSQGTPATEAPEGASQGTPLP